MSDNDDDDDTYEEPLNQEEDHARAYPLGRLNDEDWRELMLLMEEKQCKKLWFDGHTELVLKNMAFILAKLFRKGENMNPNNTSDIFNMRLIFKRWFQITFQRQLGPFTDAPDGKKKGNGKLYTEQEINGLDLGLYLYPNLTSERRFHSILNDPQLSERFQASRRTANDLYNKARSKSVERPWEQLLLFYRQQQELKKLITDDEKFASAKEEFDAPVNIELSQDEINHIYPQGMIYGRKRQVFLQYANRYNCKSLFLKGDYDALLHFFRELLKVLFLGKGRQISTDPARIYNLRIVFKWWYKTIFERNEVIIPEGKVKGRGTFFTEREVDALDRGLYLYHKPQSKRFHFILNDNVLGKDFQQGRTERQLYDKARSKCDDRPWENLFLFYDHQLKLNQDIHTCLAENARRATSMDNHGSSGGTTREQPHNHDHHPGENNHDGSSRTQNVDTSQEQGSDDNTSQRGTHRFNNHQRCEFENDSQEAQSRKRKAPENDVKIKAESDSEVIVIEDGSEYSRKQRSKNRSVVSEVIILD